MQLGIEFVNYVIYGMLKRTIMNNHEVQLKLKHDCELTNQASIEKTTESTEKRWSGT